MFALGLSVSVLVVALVTGASAALTQRLWDRAPWLAPAYGLLGLGLAAHLAWMLCWWSRTACILFACAVLVASVVVLVGAEFWARWRSWLPLTGLSASVMAVGVGHAFWWGWLRDPFLTAAMRYGALPGDNVLQDKFAYRLWNDLSTVRFYGDWNGSDRPPLQSGILLLTRPLETAMGVPNGAGFTDPHAMQWGLAASIVAQIIWVPGLYALLRSLRFRPGVSALAIAFVSVVPVTVWNATFTWPKLMSAGFALSALAVVVTVLLDRPERIAVPVCAAGTLFILAFLSHGAAAFVAPSPVVLTLVAFRGRGLRPLLGTSAVTTAVAALVYLPWALYGKYADPNHARLLKWHLAGVIPPDNRKFLPTLVDAYRHASWSSIREARRTNLHRVFDHDVTARLHPPSGWTDVWRTQDFFSSTFAIGLGTVVLVGWLVVWGLSVLAGRPRSPEWSASGLLILTCLGCMVLWALLLFLPDGATVHQGTYVWLLVFAAVPYAWTATKLLPLAVAVLGVQAAYIAVVYHRPNARFLEFAQPHFRPGYAALAGAGVIAVAAIVAALMASDRRSTHSPARDRQHTVQELDPVTS